MTTKYKVKVNDNMKYDISIDDIKKLDAEKTGDNQYHILEDNVPFIAELVESDFYKKKYIIKINNTSYKINISKPLDLLIDKLGFKIGYTKRINSIKAPMPGLILDIHVEAGQEVKEDDPLLILEAMKMENVITSPRDGVIKSINMSIGNTIDKGQLLIEFE